MFKLMIADDNPYILEELCNVIDWEDFDMCISGTFPNGRALLDAARENMPDVVLTDISMPVMDGISLATALRQLSSDVKIIFISSYADFSYAQKALQMQVFEYILKPFDNEQLSLTMGRTLKELQTEYYQRFEQKRTLQQVETFRTLALEKYMSELLYHSIEDSLVLPELTALEFNPGSSYRLLLALVTPDDATNMFRSNVVNRIRSILYNNTQAEYQTVLMPVTGGHFAILFIYNDECFGISNLLAQLNIDIESMTGLHTTIGFSRSAGSFAALPELYSQAEEAVAQACAMQIPILGYKAIQFSSSSGTDLQEPVEDVSLTNPRKKTSATAKNYAREMREYIESHFSEQITTRDVSQAVYLSANYANQLFVTECGCTIYEYVTQCRIREAKKLLAETDKQIVLIAELVGYNGKTNFYLSFKRNVGITPNEYRRRAEDATE